LISDDWNRVLAVLVVATPCPLILAAPVAIIGGINRAARRSIIVRHGGALEALASVNTAVFDKTGTLTVGKPRVHQVVTDNGLSPEGMLALAAAVEQASGHLLARVIVAEAERRGATIRMATDVVETPGRGVIGRVNGRMVAVGSPEFVREAVPAIAARLTALDAGTVGLRAYVAAEPAAEDAAGDDEDRGSGEQGLTVARIEFADQLREELGPMFAELAALGIRDAYLLSGDTSANVAKIARDVGITQYEGDLTAEAKVARIAALQQRGRRVVMVGDGTNDAPSLSTATVGIALAGHGGGVVAEAADIVLLIDDPRRVPEAVRIGRRSLRIAKQSIGVGLGLSIIGMGFAAAGLLTPIAGAFIQEAIDVAVILNALRAATDGRTTTTS
jgi:cation transport ATPase